jgi:hypothetical protein
MVVFLLSKEKRRGYFWGYFCITKSDNHFISIGWMPCAVPIIAPFKHPPKSQSNCCNHFSLRMDELHGISSSAKYPSNL